MRSGAVGLANFSGERLLREKAAVEIEQGLLVDVVELEYDVIPLVRREGVADDERVVRVGAVAGKELPIQRVGTVSAVVDAARVVA